MIAGRIFQFFQRLYVIFFLRNKNVTEFEKYRGNHINSKKFQIYTKIHLVEFLKLKNWFKILFYTGLNF